MKNVHEIEIKLTTEWEKCLDDAFKKKDLELKVFIWMLLMKQ